MLFLDFLLYFRFGINVGHVNLRHMKNTLRRFTSDNPKSNLKATIYIRLYKVQHKKKSITNKKKNYNRMNIFLFVLVVFVVYQMNDFSYKVEEELVNKEVKLKIKVGSHKRRTQLY